MVVHFLITFHFHGILTDELLLIKCGSNKDVAERRFEKGPSQSVIDDLTVERASSGERVLSVVDVNEIMLRCDV